MVAGDCWCENAGRCDKYLAVTDKDQFLACRDDGIPPAAADPVPCIYLGKVCKRHGHRRIGQPVYNCGLHVECTLRPNNKGLPNCEDCKDQLLGVATDEDRTKWIDPLKIVDRDGRRTTALRNLLGGGAAFLVCGGPSLKELPYWRLEERGIFSLGVNNVAGWAPVSAFTCSDPPEKFHPGIFEDPKIIKLLPEPKMRGNRARLRTKVGDKFYWSGRYSYQCPNVWGYERRSWLRCDDSWFTGAGAAWGNHNKGVQQTGEAKTVNTMFLGLRLLQYLGAKTIFLLGVDFWMDPSRDVRDNYAFGEHRDEDACESNNRQYIVANDWFCRLRPVFEQFGFRTYNCYRESRLRAFDYVPFEKALEIVRGRVPASAFDLEGFYAKVTEEEPLPA